MSASSISKNIKTLYSVDFTTDCPKRRKGKACKYCYVECARNVNFNAKKIHNYLSYKREILGFRKSTIDTLNSVGGIRLFSFGDYMPEHDADIRQFLDDCEYVGLKVKVITKQLMFVLKYNDHPAINVINISVDNVGDGVNWKLAKIFREKFSNVKIRCAIMKDEDIEALSFVDIFTFNHSRGLKKYGYKKYKKAEVKEWHKKLDGKVCCFSGKCSDCELKCGSEM